MMNDPDRDQLITRFGLHPLAGATHVTDAQIKQTRRETLRRRFERIQAANDAVDAYMHADGTTDYQAAFVHILRTRPDLFAGMPDPSHVVVVANFNPYHDRLGRFTTSDDAVAPHGRQHHSSHGTHLPTFDVRGHGKHREHCEPPTQDHGRDAAGQTNTPKKGYKGDLTAGVRSKQKTATGHCLPIVMREAIAEVSKLQTKAMRDKLMAQGAELYPDGSLQVDIGSLEQGIRKDNPQRTFDFDGDGPDSGADPSNTSSGRIRWVEAGVTPGTSSAQADERGLQAAAYLRQRGRGQAFFVRGDANAFAPDAGRRRRR